MQRWRLLGFFAEYIAKNARHLEDAIHKRIAGLDVTTKEQTVRSLKTHKGKRK